MKTMAKFAVAAIVASLATETLAEEWNVSLWGKRRAFTEHVEKLAELVSAKTNGEFTMNISYGGLSKNRENLDGISIGAFEMAQFCAGYHRDKTQPSLCWNCRSWMLRICKKKWPFQTRFMRTPPRKRIWHAGTRNC